MYLTVLPFSQTQYIIKTSLHLKQDTTGDYGQMFNFTISSPVD